MFCAGINEEDKKKLLELMHMNEGTFPVRYLGVPLISRRLLASDCSVLVDKITTRIDSWLSRHLSFAGRLQLINSILVSLQTFWARVFILPMKIVRLIEQKLNRFLWCGKDIKAKAKVSWVNVCFPKKEGGLGIKQLEVWNRAAMMSHIWSLFTRAGSLWVAWVETIWLKGRSFWYIPIPSSCSWSWRKLLKLRELAKQLISFNIGKVSRVFLWCDNWHPEGCLLEKYGHRAVYDAGSNVEARVSSIIRDGEWYWPAARSERIVEIQSRLSEVLICDDDQPIWRSTKGTYSCAETWDFL
jgi:hypothetical protein